LTADAERNEASVIAPVSGGPPRTLLRVSASEHVFFHYNWTPDGRAVLLATGPYGGPPTDLWLAPLEGSPRRLHIDMRRWVEGGHFQVHPDGRHMVFVASAGEPGAEIWALENVLPKPEEAR
jgi:Tol biopolymer transport system component